MSSNPPKRETSMEWQSLSLQDVVSCKGGTSFPPALQGRKSGAIPFYKVSDMNAAGNARFMDAANNYVEPSDLPRLKGKQHEPLSVIFPKVGGALLTNKKRMLSVPSLVDNNIMVVRSLDSSICNPHFLLMLFESIDLRELSNPGPLPSINAARVYERPVSLPPLPEQKKIAAVLLKIQRAIETQEKIIQSLSDLKKSTMQHLFTRGLRGEKTKMTEIGEIPESWELVTLRTCCQVKSSTIAFRDLETMDTRNEDDVAVHAIKVSDMNLPGNDRDIVRANIEIRLPEAVAKKKAVSPLSIVFPKRGAAIATNKKRLTKEWALLDPNLIATVPDDSIMPLYLYYWFLTFDLTSLQDLGPTPQLNKKNVDPVEFPVPRTKDEQEEVASILDTIDAKLRLHESNKSVLQDLFKITLNNLMTGDIRVGDLDIDVKEVKP